MSTPLPTLPSLTPMPPLPLASPEYPMQMLVGDYFEAKGKTWLVLADRFTGWLSVFYFVSDASARKLVEIFREYFSTFGVACEISSDSGSQYTSHEFATFLEKWGVSHRKSAEYNPHSNLRAESAIKSAKRSDLWGIKDH